MDPTLSLSEDFSQLSVGNQYGPRRITVERDSFTDDDHKRLDEEVLDMFRLFRKFKEEPSFPQLLGFIANGDNRLINLTTVEARALMQREPWVSDVLKSAWDSGLFKTVRQLAILWPAVKKPQQVVDNLLPRVSAGQSETATVRSWDIKYVGEADNMLYDHLANFPKDEDKYARYTSIVQSSGMGKSRTIDELSKKHLVVPLNLRQEPKGFPPPDEDVRDWLLDSKLKTEAFTRAGAFLCALFTILLRYLQQIDDEIAGLLSFSNGKKPRSRAAKFRLLMTADQTFSRQGEARQRFYNEVLTLANEIWIPPPLSTPPREPMPSSPGLSFNTITDDTGNTLKHDLRVAVEMLMKFLEPGFNVLNEYPPLLIISVDEAHPLATLENDSIDGPWSRFFELRRALRVIHPYPCFSIFLSTTGKVSQFMPQRQNDPSDRVQSGLLGLMPPFCEFGFDQLARSVTSKQTTLDDVASQEFIASLGRPLFAARYMMGDDDIKKFITMFAGEKLLCRSFTTTEQFVRSLTEVEKMACMSVRIPLEFTARTLRSQEMEMTLVEKHMRVCLSVDSGFESAITVAPSEPLLAEASYLLMRSPAFDLPRSLLAELEHPGLDKGSRGELIVMILCLEARDAAAKKSERRITPVCDFIQELLALSAHAEVLGSKPIRARTYDEDKTLEETFRKSNMYFNHFVKLRDSRLVNRKYLLGLAARGAAGICADFQAGLDIVIPIVFKDNVLKRENVSAILIQGKNDKKYKETPTPYLFDSMDPYKIGFFDAEEDSPVPVIRMVFALASPTPSTVVQKRAERKQQERAGSYKADFQLNKYTAFDIWCARASQETFRPVRDDHVFQRLLLRSRTFPEVYQSKGSDALENATRNMNPATDVHPAHWERFFKDI